MRLLRSTDGAALVTALMLTMLALVVSMALLYSVTTEMRVAASKQRYRSALAATQGGVEIVGREIFPELFDVDVKPLSPERKLLEVQGSLPEEMDLKLANYACLQQKLHSRAYKWTLCDEEQLSPDPASSPDMLFTVKGYPHDYTVLSKIVDTVPGNSDKNSRSEYLDSGSAVAGKDEAVRPKHVPALYTLSVQGEKEGEGGPAREKARLSVLYAY